MSFRKTCVLPNHLRTHRPSHQQTPGKGRIPIEMAISSRMSGRYSFIMTQTSPPMQALISITMVLLPEKSISYTRKQTVPQGILSVGGTRKKSCDRSSFPMLGSTRSISTTREMFLLLPIQCIGRAYTVSGHLSPLQKVCGRKSSHPLHSALAMCLPMISMIGER